MGRRQGALPVVLVAGVLAAGSLGCAGSVSESRSEPDPPSAAAALRTGRSYVAAYEARDGRRVCRLLDPAIALAAVRSADDSARDCERFLTREIGSPRPGVEEEGEWQGARVIRARVIEVNGREAVLRLRLGHRSQGGVGGGSGRFSQTDTLHLVARDGRWLLSKPGRILYTALGVSSNSEPATVRDPPGDADALNMPASLPRPRFACRGRRSLRVADPATDVWAARDESVDEGVRRVAAPALDLRAVRVRQARSGTVCVTIDLARPVRPDTLVRFYWRNLGTGPNHQQTGERTVRVDGRGRVHDLDFAEGRDNRYRDRGNSRSGGLRRSLSMQIPFRDGLGPLPGHRFDFSVSVESLQREELWLDKPLQGRDTLPGDADGDGGGTSRFPP